MRYSNMLALAMGNVAFAQFNATVTPAPNPDDGENGGGAGGNDIDAGLYEFYGCVGSTAGFPTFELRSTSAKNGPKFCSEQCNGRFFGLYDDACYCGEELDDSDTARVGNDRCDIKCPDGEGGNCGGSIAPSRMSRRQNVPLTVLLSVYIRVGGESETETVTDTVTATTTRTITQCPTEYPDCGLGSVTTETWTYTTTYCPIPTENPIVCYGNWCGYEHHCEECSRHRVVYDNGKYWPEECHADDDHWDHLVHCDGDDCKYNECQGEECNKKIVCYGNQCSEEKCEGEGCRKNWVCQGAECYHEACEGDNCWTKHACDGDDCKPEPVPVCKDNCPKPPAPQPPVYPPPTTTGGVYCDGPDCNNGNNNGCEGPECPKEPECDGENCPNKPGQPGQPGEPECNGENCPTKPGQPECDGENCPNKPGQSGQPGEPECNGENCPTKPEQSQPECNGVDCPAQPECTDCPPVVTASAGKMIPAVGLSAVAFIAGVAFL